MKTNKFKMVLAGICALASIQAQAQDFGGKNGGDTQEKRFNQIADDLRNWIFKGGAQGLNLPKGVDRETYETKMLDALVTYSVSFTPDKIEVNGAEKDCENIAETKLLRCNIDRFKNSSESEQYVLVHHEYAGLSGFEKNEGKARSNYFISDQITGSLETVTMMKLVVKNKTPVIVLPQCTVFLHGGSFAIRRYQGINMDREKSFSFMSAKTRSIFLEKQYTLTKKRSRASLDVHVEASIQYGKLRTKLWVNHLETGYVKTTDDYVDIVTVFPKDPYNVAIEEKMKIAKNATEYNNLKNQLNPALNRTPIINDVVDLIFKNLPSCSEVLGTK